MDGFLLRSSWTIMTVMGIPIRVHYSWLIVFGLITWSLSTYYFPAAAPDLPATSYWIKGAVAAFLLFWSVAFHELAHALVSRRYRMSIINITLFIFGGVAQMKGEPPTPKAELRIALAGPLSSLFLSAVFFLLSLPPFSPGVKALYAYLAQLNLALGLFNLIPGFPMDGGRVLRSLIWERKKDYFYATRKSSDLGQKIALFFIFFGLLLIFMGSPGGLWLMLIGWFLYSAAQVSYRQANLQEALSGITVREVMVKDMVVIDASITLSEAVDKYFLRYAYGGFPVFDGGRYLGIITLREVKDVPREEWEKAKVADVVVPHEAAWEVSPDLPVMKALESMITEDRGRLIVVDGGRIAGLITRNGVAQYVKVLGK